MMLLIMSNYNLYKNIDINKKKLENNNNIDIKDIFKYLSLKY